MEAHANFAAPIEQPPVDDEWLDLLHTAATQRRDSERRHDDLAHRQAELNAQAAHLRAESERLEGLTQLLSQREATFQQLAAAKRGEWENEQRRLKAQLVELDSARERNDAQIADILNQRHQWKLAESELRLRCEMAEREVARLKEAVVRERLAAERLRQALLSMREAFGLKPSTDN
jgi:chromosome segregation ATPase